MTKIPTLEGLYDLPESTPITDANGVAYVRHSGPKPTANPNWIAWISGGVYFHSEQIALPATTNKGSAA